MYRLLIKPFLFLLSPESAHSFVTGALKFFSALPGFNYIQRSLFDIKDAKLKRTVFGITFDNPVGLAAGFDKDAVLFEELAGFGFGFIEVGTVTPLPQPGNQRPRLFRLPSDQALINRMGFNNDGAEAMAERLQNRKPGMIIGGNIGKNKNTTNEEAVKDYEKCLIALFPYVDYFTVNVSSPNTPGLRSLQEKEPLKKILRQLKTVNSNLAASSSSTAVPNNKSQISNYKPKPILLKIAPDLTNEELDDIIEIVKETSIDGIVATNTTISRDGLSTSGSKVNEMGSGGLSGKPLSRRSTEVIRYIHDKSGGTIPIIGVGGIHSAKDAIEKLKAGASLVQLYTGFIYEGPGLVKKINKALLAL